MIQPISLKQPFRSLVSGGWLAILVAIPLLSVYGRSLQHWVANHLGYQLAAWIISISLVILISAYLIVLNRHSISFPRYHLLWFLPLFLFAPLLLDRVEERLHFLSFGLFGALTLVLFKPRLAIIICLLLSIGDEVLQYFLPDRVGDWRDVLMNTIASLGAALFIWVSYQIGTQDQ